MKLLIAGALYVFLVPLSGAQAPQTGPTRNGTQTAHVKPKQEVLPQTTLAFKPVGDGLPLLAQIDFFSHIVCGADGTFYFNAETLPGGERQVIAVSPQEDEVSSYNMASIMGLVNVNPLATDAEGSDIYVLAGAAKSEDLVDNDVQPGSPEVRKYTRLFILHFHGKPSTPDVIQVDLPFQPRQFAATSDGEFVFLGLESTNQAPVLAVIDGSGELDHYIDADLDFGSDASMVANAPQQIESPFQTTPEGAPLDFALVDAQFVHYRDSLLLLMPGVKAKIFTIRGGGAIESTTLHLPAGLEAESLIPSDNGWLIRATDGTAWRKLIVMIDPSDGKALRIIHSPQFGINDITCVHDGDYYGIRWPGGEKANDKAMLMKAAP